MRTGRLGNVRANDLRHHLCSVQWRRVIGENPERFIKPSIFYYGVILSCFLHQQSCILAHLMTIAFNCFFSFSSTYKSWKALDDNQPFPSTYITLFQMLYKKGNLVIGILIRFCKEIKT